MPRCIYKITNLINNKIYIGKTKKDIETRFKEHLQNAINNCQYNLSKAIRKYGIDNFNIEMIDTAESDEELNQKEIFYIHKFNSLLNGYNMTYGGEGGNTYIKLNYEKLLEVKRKISIKAKQNNSNRGQYIGSLNGMYGKNHSEKTKQQISNKLKGRKKPKDHGKHISESTKGVKKDYIPAVVKLYVISVKYGIVIERLSAKEIVEKYNIKNFKVLKNIVDNKLVINNLIFSKSVSTIPDECMGVGTEISTVAVLGNESAENRSAQLSNQIEDIVSANSNIR